MYSLSPKNWLLKVFLIEKLIAEELQVQRFKSVLVDKEISQMVSKF